MNILVTGGAGFIGSNIVDEYVAAGHRVWALDNESSGTRRQVNRRATFQRLDITNKPGLLRFFKGKRIDVVNHHAAQIDVRRSVLDPAFDARINILGLLNVLDACREFKVKKILFSSSGGTIYGECRRPAVEGDPEVPISPYGVAKLASEKYIKSYHALHGLAYTIFRYSNVYGLRQDPMGEAGVVAIFSNRLLAGEPCTIYGTGNQSRDFVFVQDVAKANSLALRSGANEVLNIGSGEEISISELYRAMAKLLLVSKPAVRKPARSGELQRSILTAARARRLIGWKPRFSLSQGLDQTIRYFAEHGPASGR